MQLPSSDPSEGSSRSRGAAARVHLLALLGTMDSTRRDGQDRKTQRPPTGETLGWTPTGHELVAHLPDKRVMLPLRQALREREASPRGRTLVGGWAATGLVSEKQHLLFEPFKHGNQTCSHGRLLGLFRACNTLTYPCGKYI